ncbi:MAG: SDR family NAD(P)-dependent oxidoreductase [Anaerolineae bacterium]
MEIDLMGWNALVTGGAGGIGRACARTLAACGARVAIVDLNEAGAQAAAAELDGAIGLRCDIGDPEDVARMCAAVEGALGSIDIVINCAGIIAYRNGIGAVSLSEWDTVLDVNLRGSFLVCQHVIEGMKQRRRGKIVNFSSLAARVGGIEVGVHYAASKAGLIALTKTLAKEGGPYGIHVNAVAPGVISTDPVKKQVGDHESAYTATIPLRRLGEPEDVANVVLFLCSSLSDYITGLVIDVNGGQFMG